MQEFVPFPMQTKFNEIPRTEFVQSKDSIVVEMLDCPNGDFRGRCFDMIMSTWADDAFDYRIERTRETIQDTFNKLLGGKVLPNSMESLQFTFRIEGLTLIEITHLLRHRQLRAIHAQCTADRFLTNDSAMIPTSIHNSIFRERYELLTNLCKELYQDMCDSKDVSLMDARYILPRNSRYFYTITIDLGTAIQFIKQRRCTAIQPELDNEIARQMYMYICSVIPEVQNHVSLFCDHTCHTTFGNDEHTTRLYQPDENHGRILSAALAKRTGGDDAWNPDNFIYTKTREQMGSFYTDETKHETMAFVERYLNND